MLASLNLPVYKPALEKDEEVIFKGKKVKIHETGFTSVVVISSTGELQTVALFQGLLNKKHLLFE